MRVLVLGAYGLIGREIAARLRAEGHAVIGFGRSAAKGLRLTPEIEWRGGDLAQLTKPDAWRPHLANIDAIVNASGALQDGARDNLELAQNRAIQALIEAAEQASVKTFVQISAPGAVPEAKTAFLRTKAAADQRLRASALDWIIFKPGLVISANAYGGTSLIRMLAAFPFVQPLALAKSRIQTISARDVAEAVSLALSQKVQLRGDYDLVEDEPHSLAEIVAAFRAWLGFPKALTTINLPAWFGWIIAQAADIAGQLGWRSPLRSTALRVLQDNVTGDANAWMQASGRALSSLPDTLRNLPATAQERIYARAQLVFPALLITLSLFWLASGLIGLARINSAAAVLAQAFPPEIAMLFVLLGSLADCAIGAAMLLRPLTRGAAFASIALAIAYLVAGSLFTPLLWLDPLGAFVKVFPAIAAALCVAALAEER